MMMRMRYEGKTEEEGETEEEEKDIRRNRLFKRQR